MTTRTAPDLGAPDVAALARRFGERADCSARSVLVTIFGDSVVPTGGEIWLGDLIALCEPFGFSDRLVRTSLFRLSAEGWFETERVGRRSRYRLTPTAIDEFAAAEGRIYHLPRADWDGTWTLVLLGGPGAPAGDEAADGERAGRDRLAAALRTRGYVELLGGVLAVPRADDAGSVSRLAGRTGVSGPVPVATAQFPDLAALVADGWPLDRFGLEPLAGRYRDLTERYRWAAGPTAAGLADRDAFLTRTMLVHELRRVRLADPDLPPQLWPPGWPAAAAVNLAATAYRQLSPGAWRWLRAGNELAGPCRAMHRFH